MPRMALCIFCGHAPAVNFALTALNGEPRETPHHGVEQSFRCARAAIEH